MDFFEGVLNKSVVIGNGDILKDEDALHVAFGIDENFAIGMGVLMASMLKHNSKKLVFNIITDKIKARDVARIEKLYAENKKFVARIFYINSGVFDKLPTTFIWSKATYYRFLVERFVTEPNRVLYIDVDMLCLGDFSDLYTREMNKEVALVVEDDKSMVDVFKARYNFQGEKYFNAGMILIHLDNWRKNRISKQCIDLLFSNDFKYLDQDALNATIYNKVIYINKRYNNLQHMTNINADKSSDTIFLHLSGSVKPWQRWGEKHKLTKLWVEYRDDSPWEDEPIMEPKTYKHAKFMSRMYKDNGELKNTYKWKFKYAVWKLKERIGHL